MHGGAPWIHLVVLLFEGVLSEKKTLLDLNALEKKTSLPMRSTHQEVDRLQRLSPKRPTARESLPSALIALQHHRVALGLYLSQSCSGSYSPLSSHFGRRIWPPQRNPTVKIGIAFNHPSGCLWHPCRRSLQWEGAASIRPLWAPVGLSTPIANMSKLLGTFVVFASVVMSRLDLSDRRDPRAFPLSVLQDLRGNFHLSGNPVSVLSPNPHVHRRCASQDTSAFIRQESCASVRPLVPVGHPLQPTCSVRPPPLDKLLGR